VETIQQVATTHGFRLSGFRSFEHAVTDAMIARVKQQVRR
jgi:hypothetical protein